MSFDNATCPSSSLPYSRSRMSIGSSTQCSSSSVSSESPHEPYSTFHFQPSSAFGTYHGDALRLKIDPYQDITSEDISPSPATSCQASPVEHLVAKRGRGRPRKHPIIPPADPDDTKSRVKNRSKTGCLTCRRRKKKCDESKPTCLNCQKNNAICEGYPQLQPWQTRKNRKSKGRQETSGLPILIDGVENDADRRALDHFNLKLSKKLNPWKDGENPFHHIVFPMALSHLGLMHSLLCLSACHLSQLDPDDREMEQRHLHHKDIALNILLAEENLHPPPDAQPSHIDDPTIAQLLMFCLESACAGAKDGEHHYHMNAARHVLSTQRSNNVEFHRFILDLFMFHDVSSSITSLNRPPIPLMEDFHLPDFIPTEAGTLFGVLDGLFGYISKITNLRNRIRERRNSGLRPFIDYDTLSDAQMVDADLRCWRNPQKKGTERYAAAMLYHLCTWIYLHRTVLPSVPNHSLRDAVDDGLGYVNRLSQDESSAQAILLMPVFLLGCAAFEWRQRPEILEAFDRLAAYRCSRNIEHTRTVVQLLWQMMDQGDEDSWDWETLMQRMGLDFLVT